MHSARESVCWYGRKQRQSIYSHRSTLYYITLHNTKTYSGIVLYFCYFNGCCTTQVHFLTNAGALESHERQNLS